MDGKKTKENRIRKIIKKKIKKKKQRKMMKRKKARGLKSEK